MNLAMQHASTFLDQAIEEIDTELEQLKTVHIPVRFENDSAYVRINSHIEGKPEYQIYFTDEPEQRVEAF